MDRAEELWDRIQKFGEVVIKAMVVDFEVENQWLEFKKSSGFEGASGNSLSNSDYKNLCKTVSAYANTEGGLIIWGVECKSDAGRDIPLANRSTLVSDPLKLKSLLEGATSRCTTPSVTGIRHVHVASGMDSERGYVVTYVPKSHAAPHKDSLERRYYFRSGSNCAEMPDILLAALFGRRPVSELELTLERTVPLETNQLGQPLFQVDLTVDLMNKGPRLVERPFFALKYTLPSPNCLIRVESLLITSGHDDWREYTADGSGYINGLRFPKIHNYTLTPKVGYPLFAGQSVRIAKIKFAMTGPFYNDLMMELNYGHEESPVSTIRFHAPVNDLNTLWPTLSDQNYAGGNRDKFIRTWVGLKDYEGTFHEGERLQPSR